MIPNSQKSTLKDKGQGREQPTLPSLRTGQQTEDSRLTATSWG